jgi:hypothetical protein
VLDTIKEKEKIDKKNRKKKKKEKKRERIGRRREKG